MVLGKTAFGETAFERTVRHRLADEDAAAGVGQSVSNSAINVHVFLNVFDHEICHESSR